MIKEIITLMFASYLIVIPHINKYEYKIKNDSKYAYLGSSSMNFVLNKEVNNVVDKEEKKNTYKLNKVSDNEYYITLYDESGNKYHDMFSPVEPGLRELDTDTLEINISVGSPARYTTFVDLNNKIISKSYFNYLAFDDGKVVYYENGSLIIADAFEEELIYKVITKNFSPAATSPIIKVKFIDANMIYFEYFEGQEYIEKTETVNLLD